MWLSSSRPLSDRALDWAIGYHGEQSPNWHLTLLLFLNEFKATFDHPSGGADAAGRLHSIIQGSRSVAEYTLELLTLAADSGLGRHCAEQRVLEGGSLRT